MKKNSFVGGTLLATLSIVITKFLGIIYIIPFYKIIGGSGSALYSYAYNLYVIFLDISTCGLPIAVSKVINRYDTLKMNDRKKQTFYIGKRMMRYVSFIMFGIMFIFSTKIAYFLAGDLSDGNNISSVSFSIKCVSFSLLIVPSLSVLRGYLQGHRIMSVSGKSQVLEQIIKIIVSLLGAYIVVKCIHRSVSIAVYVSLLGTFIGALVCYLYITFKIGKVYIDNKKLDWSIVKELLKYCIPFIIINLLTSLYNFVDMSIILKTFSWLGYDGVYVEYVSSSVTTWAPKINMIVTSIAMGMSMSIIPTIVNLFTLKKYSDVNDNINQAISIIFFVSLPIIFFISFFSKYVWTLFYGYNEIGYIILRINIYLGLFVNLFMILSSILQGLDKFKIVYLSTIIGFVINIVFDVPLIIIFNKIGYGYLGTIVSSIIGYLTSILIILLSLNENGFELNIISSFKKLLLPMAIVIIYVIIVDKLFFINSYSRLSCLIYLVLVGFGYYFIYLFVCYKKGIISKVFGDDIIKKLTFGKLKD